MQKKINVRFRYQLSTEQVEDLISGNEIDDVLNHKTISIRLQSATNKYFMGRGIHMSGVR